jgi:phospholipase C
MDLDDGNMDGFIAPEHAGRHQSCAATQDPSCSQAGPIDVMGSHDAHETPNYWAYTQQFVLQDPMSRTNNLQLPSGTTYLLAGPRLSAASSGREPAYYLDEGAQSYRGDDAMLTSMINAVMQGPEWNTTAIFLK